MGNANATPMGGTGCSEETKNCKATDTDTEGGEGVIKRIYFFSSFLEK